MKVRGGGQGIKTTEVLVYQALLKIQCNVNGKQSSQNNCGAIGYKEGVLQTRVERCVVPG